MLKEIIDKQITRQVKNKLGRISVPSVKPVVFSNTISKANPAGSTLHWGKRSYYQDRGSTQGITRQEFYNYKNTINRTLLAPQAEGMLYDSEIGLHNNIEYAIEVLAKNTVNNSISFQLGVNGGGYANVYVRKKRQGSSGNSASSYTISQIATNVRRSTVSLNISDGEWTTIFIYLYGHSDSVEIAGFERFTRYLDSWRLPDVIAPAAPTWYGTPLETGSDPVSGQTYVILRWNFPDENELVGNGIYFYSEEDTGFNVVSQSPDPLFNGIITSASTSDALQDFPSGTSVYPNDDHAYVPSGSLLASENSVTNNMFTSTSGPNTWTGWTVTNSAAYSTVQSTLGTFYMNGACIFASTEPSGNTISTYISHDANISVDTALQYNFSITYKNESYDTTLSYLQLNYIQSNGVTPCASRAYQFFRLQASSAWTTAIVKVYNSTVQSHIYDVATTSQSFKLPTDCAYVKPTIYFHYSTSITTKFYLDNVKFGEAKIGDVFSTESGKRVAVKFKQKLKYPDTPYCSLHCDYLNTPNDTYRGITGTLATTGEYFSSAYFAKFGTSLAIHSNVINKIVNGHFDNGTTSWTNNGLPTFSLSSTSLFGSNSLKIVASGTDQYVSQSVSVSNNDTKYMSFYARGINSSGVRLVGKLSGSTAFDQSRNYSTSNWQRMCFEVSSVDSIEIYPYYNTAYFTGSDTLFLDGVQFTTTSQPIVCHYPYDTVNDDGSTMTSQQYIDYPGSVISTATGTIEFWYRPVQYQTALSNYPHLIFFHFGDDQYNFWKLGYSNGQFQWWTSSSHPNEYKYLYFNKHLVANDPIHIALTWHEREGAIYINGKKSTAAVNGNDGITATSNILYHVKASTDTSLFRVGGNLGSPSNYYFDSMYGYLDGLRVEKCRYDNIHINRDYAANMMVIRG